METEAIVVDSTDYGESDLIVTFLGKGTGRITAIAKGARKSKKRFVNKLEIFSFLQISIRIKQNNSMGFLEEAELHSSFLSLRKNIKLYATASIVREFLLFGIREAEVSDEIFRLSVWTLHRLNLNAAPSSVLVFFLIRFYDHLGYRPDLDGCSRCGKPFEVLSNFSFDLTAGRLICAGCQGVDSQRCNLSPGTIKMLQTALRTPLHRLHQLKISENLRREALAMLHVFGREIFQKDIVSWNYGAKHLSS